MWSWFSIMLCHGIGGTHPDNIPTRLPDKESLQGHTQQGIQPLSGTGAFCYGIRVSYIGQSFNGFFVRPFGSNAWWLNRVSAFPVGH